MFIIRKLYFGINIKKCTFLGKGCEGKVYLTPDGKVIKIFFNKIQCDEEYDILKKVEGSKFFPKVIAIENQSILREYVGGVNLKKYLRKNKLSKKLAVNIIRLIEEFEKLNFTRLDMLSRHIFVQKDETVIVIDPRKTYTANVPVPNRILREIEKSSDLEFFIRVLIENNPKLAVKWFVKEIKG